MLETLMALVVSVAAPAGANDCDHTRELSARVPATGAEVARVIARAGALEVHGRPGLQEVRVRAVACASHARYLDGFQLETGRSGDGIRIEAVVPETTGWMNHQALLDLIVEVPEGMTLDVEDSSGATSIRGVAALRLEDGSGELEIEDVRGPVRVEDGSGEMMLRGIQGDVVISDGSGEIEIEGVNGSVLVERDGSGEMDLRDVRGDVIVRRDASGEISVYRVGGDFRVERDGSGRIRFSEVSGTVDVPRRR